MHSLLLRLAPVILLSTLMLSGCASQEAAESATKESPHQPMVLEEAHKETVASEGESVVEQKAQDIPERQLGEEHLALLLQAEFALYRKDLVSALEIYEQLAQSTFDPGIAKRATEVAMATSDPFRALDAALLYLELAPDNDEAIGFAARALARSAEVEGAWALLEAYPEKTYELRMTTAEAVRLAAQMKDNYQIKWLLQEIINKYGDNSGDKDIQLSLALIYEALGNFEKTAFYAEQSTNQGDDNTLSVRLQANALLQLGKKEQASTLLSTWITHHPEEPEARISMVQMLLAFDQEAALPLLETLSEAYPWSGQLLMSTAQLHLAANNREAAIPYYQKLAQFGNYRNISLFNLGRIYEQGEELQRAAEYYAIVSAEKVSEEDANIIFEAGLRHARIEYQIGDNGAMLFEELRQLYPDQSLGLIHEEARLLLANDHFQQAIDVLSIGITDSPDSEALLYTRSIAYERSDDIDSAVEDLETILSFDDANSVALNALGYTLANRTTRYEEAFDLIDRALSIDPEDPAIIDSMGWVLYHMGRYEEALDYLKRAHASMLDEEVISHLAEVLWKMDRNEEAKQILDQGLVDLPDSQMIPQTLIRLGFGT